MDIVTGWSVEATVSTTSLHILIVQDNDPSTCLVEGVGASNWFSITILSSNRLHQASQVSSSLGSYVYPTFLACLVEAFSLLLSITCLVKILPCSISSSTESVKASLTTLVISSITSWLLVHSTGRLVAMNCLTD